MGNMIHREQSFGEIRGLQRLQDLITDRMVELELKTGKRKPTDFETNDNI